MQKYLLSLTLFAALLFANCQNNTDTTQAPDEKIRGRGSSEDKGPQCVLSKDNLLGIRIGDTLEVIGKRSKPALIPDKVKNGEGEFQTYLFTATNKEKVRIYPIEKGGKQIVHLLEYSGAGCQTEKGVGVSSTLAALRQAYPDLTVHGSEIEGRTTATGGGWRFLMGDQHFTVDVDINSLNPDIRVTAILMQ